MRIPTLLKKTAILSGVAVMVVMLASASLSLESIARAASPAGTPNVQIRIGDDKGDVSPELPRDCGRDVSPWVGNGEGVALLPPGGNNDADCIQVRILGGSMGTEYARDFKICLGLPSAIGCTPWASEGGGFSGTYYNGNGHINGAQIFVVDRDMPVTGMKVTNVQAGVQFYYQKDNGPCRGSSGMAFSSGAESVWAYGEQQDNDPGCGRVGLLATQVLPPNAQYVSDTVPDVAQASTDYDASITMRNTGMTWASDQIITPEQNNCDPQENGETCSDVYVVQSGAFQLKRVDTSALTAPATLPYKRTINVTYTRYRGEDCEIVPGGEIDGPIEQLQQASAGRSWIGRVASALVPTAYALPQPGTTVCRTFDFVSRYETPARDVNFNATADFPVTVGTPAAAGTYNLQYQMQRIGTGTVFGEVADIPVTIEGDGQGVGLSCRTVSQTVDAGQVASYSVGASSLNGFAGDVRVTASNLPVAATADPIDITVPAGGTGNGILPVLTDAATPAGTYSLTFTATAPSIAPRTCTSELVVRSGATLVVSPVWQQAGVGAQATFGASFDSDGPAGPAAPVDVTSAAAWSAGIPGIAQSLGNGRFMANATGTTPVVAAYNGITGTASLEVGTPAATFRIEPANASVLVGGQVAVRAMLDPDGSGPQAAFDATGDSAWSSGSTAIAQSLGNGSFRGVAAGRTTMIAVYELSTGNYLTASGNLDVNDADSARLEIVPSSASTQVGAQVSVRALYYPDGGTDISSAQDVTGSAEWTSSNPGVAASIGGGVYRGVAPGSAPITARYDAGNVSGNITGNGTISVGQVGGGGCTFTASPSSLFIPPQRPATLSWQCDHPTSCTITNVTDGGTVASGNESGSGQHSPRHTTTYRLSCDNGATLLDKIVRVFDVTTRIEILPR